MMNDQLLKSYIKEIQNVINSKPHTYLLLSSEKSTVLNSRPFLRRDLRSVNPIGHLSDNAKIIKVDNLGMSRSCLKICIGKV